MPKTTFDALRYYERLKAAGVPEEQVKIQAVAMREFSLIQEETLKKELATKGDVRESELRLAPVSAGLFALSQNFQNILPIIGLAKQMSHLFHGFIVNPAFLPGNFLQTGDFKALPCFYGLDVGGCGHQA